MSDQNISFYNPNPYIPASLSEINDFFYHMIGAAPTFVGSGTFRDDDIDLVYFQLNEAFGVVRKKLGEERYAAMMDLAARSKALFEADPEETNGQTMDGIKLIWEMMDLVRATRKRRAATKQPDDDGEVTGD